MAGSGIAIVIWPVKLAPEAKETVASPPSSCPVSTALGWVGSGSSSRRRRWPARACHGAVTKRGRIYILGGQNFGLIPWNAGSPADVKYDYDTIAAPAGRDGRGRAIYTFGGDRETLDLFDPTQWLDVDNDVWRFALPKKKK